MLDENSIDTFVDSYIRTALWSSSDISDENENSSRYLDENFTKDDLSPSALKKINKDCSLFIEKTKEMIKDRYSGAGHDFWLTRNRHGAGFWDGDWKEYGGILTDICKSEEFGNCDIYPGDDGLLYISGSENNIGED